ncbi:hypothetical protein IEN85_17780 [Pelagicoccus sp. NFK12]|uniref:Lipoprotein n=1 Tax=Pelagicoccus enzymogenes TaxID=2773457 RepID=A0A927FCP3_9BACT|nr:hypothetical protein [Pelagicoccus enzymogenes]MBD5781356.1 hypothetical protein [Pelagicoccus enzymogenes]MDQ8199616.1 hypothetical protein [Pelagicoccus enzymogenes]
MKRRPITVVLYALAIFCLVGCESTSSSGISTRTLSKVAKPGEGYVLFSFTFAGEIEPPGSEKVVPRFDSYTFKIRPLGDPFTTYEVGLVSTSQGGYYRDFDVRQGMGFVFAEPLPAGEYELFSYEVTLQTLMKKTAIYPQAQASIPFTVSENQYSYLGRIECQHKFENLETDWTNLIHPSGLTLSWSDHQSEDKSHAYMKFPHLIPLTLREDKIGSQIESLNGPTNSILF